MNAVIIVANSNPLPYARGRAAGLVVRRASASVLNQGDSADIRPLREAGRRRQPKSTHAGKSLERPAYHGEERVRLGTHAQHQTVRELSDLR
jgi:hypothetical protein